MEKPSLNIVRAADIAAHAQEFSHPWNPNSLMRGTQLGRSVGLKRTGVNFIRVPAGKESFVYHSHRYEEEWMYVLAGSGVAFIDDQEFPMAAGENREFDVAEFPTLNKRMVRMGQQVDVYDADDAKGFGPI